MSRLSFRYTLAATITAAIGLALCASEPSAAPGNEPKSAAPAIDDSRAFLPADRATLWNPGMRGVGGIPDRSTVCATVTPSGTQDDTARIQGSINACPVGQVVQLTAGTFLINSGRYLLINKGITLRGAGPGQDHAGEDQRRQAVPERGQRAVPRR